MCVYLWSSVLIKNTTIWLYITIYAKSHTHTHTQTHTHTHKIIIIKDTRTTTKELLQKCPLIQNIRFRIQFVLKAAAFSSVFTNSPTFSNLRILFLQTLCCGQNQQPHCTDCLWHKQLTEDAGSFLNYTYASINPTNCKVPLPIQVSKLWELGLCISSFFFSVLFNQYSSVFGLS